MTTTLDHVQPIVINSHPRSGTHVTLDLFRRQFAPCRSWKWPGEKLNRLYFSLESLVADRPGRVSEREALRILGRVERPLIKTHLIPGQNFALDSATRPVPDWLGPLLNRSAFCYVFRDGREVMCSLHLYRRMADPRAACGLSQFIRQEVGGVTRVRAWAQHVEQGLARAGAIPIGFEQMTRHPTQTLEHLGAQLEMSPAYRQPLLPRKLKGLWHSRLNRLIGVRPQSTAIFGRPANAKPQKWHHAFTSDDKTFFHREAGDLLIRLGYESSDQWLKP